MNATTNIPTKAAAFSPDSVMSKIGVLDDSVHFHQISAGLGGYSITRYSRATGLVIGWIAA